ncbi:MAG: hypothetical protein O9342_04790 [Beijerinckiaceae bacterium]|nr:hypothetical protein [Beijerinckiaceae bacterium]
MLWIATLIVWSAFVIRIYWEAANKKEYWGVSETILFILIFFKDYFGDGDVRIAEDIFFMVCFSYGMGFAIRLAVRLS